MDDVYVYIYIYSIYIYKEGLNQCPELCLSYINFAGHGFPMLMRAGMGEGAPKRTSLSNVDILLDLPILVERIGKLETRYSMVISDDLGL